jgi:L,D-transpeptidase catalytic domain
MSWKSTAKSRSSAHIEIKARFVVSGADVATRPPGPPEIAILGRRMFHFGFGEVAMRLVGAASVAAAVFCLPTTAQATVQIQVDLSSQSMHVSSSLGEYDWAVSTGRQGHRTPTGYFRPQRMFVMTYSRKYQMAPMPHAIFFSGGYAIHGTYATGALGHVASHGCIRLAPENAARLYDMVRREGARIVVSGVAPGRDDLVARRERHNSGDRFATDFDAGFHEEPLDFAPHNRRHVKSWRRWADNPLESQ